MAAEDPARRWVLATVVLASTSAPVQAQERKVAKPVLTTVQVQTGENAEAALLGRIDTDQLPDLVLAVSRPDKPFARGLRIHLGNPGTPAFRQAPDYALDLPPDVTAFAIGDVHADPGSEVVLFHDGGAFVWRPRATESEQLVNLLRAEFLWQFPDPESVIALDKLIVAIDGDGLVDLILPCDGGYRIALQSRGAPNTASFERTFALTVPLDVEPRSEDAFLRRSGKGVRPIQDKLDLVFGSSSAKEGPFRAKRWLVDVTQAVPAWQVLDVNGDGRLDIVAQTERRLHFWLGGEHGFEPNPARTLRLPVPADFRPKRDLAWHSLPYVPSATRGAQLLLLRSDPKEQNAKAIAQVHALDSQGATLSEPMQSIAIDGLPGTPRIVDFDADGRMDLFVPVLRPDLLASSGVLGSGVAKAEILVFRGLADGRFSATPILRHTLALPNDSFTWMQRDVEARPLGDLDGNGLKDLLLRSAAETLLVLGTIPNGDELAVAKTPLCELRVPRRAVVRMHKGAGRVQDLLLLEGTAVTHVRFP